VTDDLGIGMVPETGLDAKGQPAFVQLGQTAKDGTPGTDGDAPGGAPWDGSAGVDALKGGLGALDLIAPKIFNILCMPAAAAFNSSTDTQAVYSAALTYCELKRAFLIVDIAPDLQLDKAQSWLTDVGITPSKNAAIYYPRVEIPDALNEYRLRDVGPSGTLAGIYARTDSTRGVWKAPAGIDATMRGAEVAVKLTDDQDGDINPLGINALRNFPIYGNVCWGARTLEGADQLASEWKYVPIRRLALFIEETLYENTKWVVFEPNDEPLWAQIRLNVGAFMHDLFRQGAFQGQAAKDAYFVKCDSSTTTQSDVNAGVVNIVVGFAPLKPAEFVVIKIQQIAGQIQT
jgi:phage tail sheath protein FI